MCGILGYVGNGKEKNAARLVFEGLKRLEYRGYDSWGVAAFNQHSGVIEVEKRIGKIGQARIHLRAGNLALGHTRWATHGGVTDINAHPHSDCSGTLAIVHNGIVENYQELKKKLLAQGHSLKSETDSEVIVHLIEELRKKNKNSSLRQAVFRAFSLLEGSNAIVLMDKESHSLFACRNGSPLVVGIAKGEYFIASDVPPFLATTRKVTYLNDGEGVVIKSTGINLFNFKTGRPKKTVSQNLKLEAEASDRGKHPHFLIKEIREQKETIPKVADLNKEKILDLARRIKKAKQVYIIACGSAYYVALTAKYFFAEAGVEAHIYGAYEFIPFANFCSKRSVIVAISQSGETADTLIGMRAGKEKGAYLAALINAQGSTLERMVDSTLLVGAGPEIAVVSTKAFTSQLTTLYLLSMATLGQFWQAQKKLKKLLPVFNEWFDKKLEAQICALARSIFKDEHAYVIGKHLNYGVAMEAALKIKETSYIHSEAFAAGELKHGVIALIEKGTPCLVFFSNDSVRGEVLASAAELKARGGKIIGVGPFNDPVFEHHIETPDLGPLTILPNLIVGQLLGYHLGLERGADPDKPRNLAKSVTVK